MICSRAWHSQQDTYIFVLLTRGQGRYIYYRKESFLPVTKCLFCSKRLPRTTHDVRNATKAAKHPKLYAPARAAVDAVISQRSPRITGCVAFRTACHTPACSERRLAHE